MFATLLATFQTLAPVFALIFAGFACRRRHLLGPAAATELNRFVVWLALPALLFDAMAHATPAQMIQPAFLGAFGLASAIVFVAVLLWRLRGRRHLADAGIDAIAAAYPNTGYIGYPLGLIVFGTASLARTTIATILIVCVLFSVAVILIEVSLQTERQHAKLAWKVLRSVLGNPLIFSPLAGLLLAVAHGTVPASAESFLKLLGAAASPCALVCLALCRAEQRPETNAEGGAVMLTVAKLILQPLLTWWLAARVFMLPGQLTEMAVLLAALPTGTGPFMLAEFYRREAYVTSRTILYSTVGSLVSLTILLIFMPHGK
jgi:malonate transporter